MVGNPPPQSERYRVEGLIAVGATGPVFAAEHPQTHDRVILKSLKTNLSDDARQQIVDEVNHIIDRLPPHPAIVAHLDVALDDGQPVVVSEFASGDALDLALERYGPAAILDLLPRLQTLAEGLDLAAEQGICHGALHPADVIVDTDSTRITGIGLPTVLARAGVGYLIRPPYSAPEVAHGEVPSSASDQFSLAAIAFEWLFGEPVSAEAVERLEVLELPGVNCAALVDVFTTALASAPKERFASCRSFVGYIEASLDESVQALVYESLNEENEDAFERSAQPDENPDLEPGFGFGFGSAPAVHDLELDLDLDLDPGPEPERFLDAGEISLPLAEVQPAAMLSTPTERTSLASRASQMTTSFASGASGMATGLASRTNRMVASLASKTSRTATGLASRTSRTATSLASRTSGAAASLASRTSGTAISLASGTSRMATGLASRTIQMATSLASHTIRMLTSLASHTIRMLTSLASLTGRMLTILASHTIRVTTILAARTLRMTTILGSHTIRIATILASLTIRTMTILASQTIRMAKSLASHAIPMARSLASYTGRMMTSLASGTSRMMTGLSLHTSRTAASAYALAVAIWTDGPSALLLALTATLMMGIAVGFSSGYLMSRQVWPVERAAAASVLEADATASASSPKPLLVRSVPTMSAAGVPARVGSAAKAEASSRLKIVSTPAGASVTVDGVNQGITPVEVTGLPLGMRSVRFTQTGYRSVERQVMLSRSRPERSLEVALVATPPPKPEPAASPGPTAPPAKTATAVAAAPPPKTTSPPAPVQTAKGNGSLVIQSQPSGATISVNGMARGTTPLTIGVLPAGPYTVRFSLPKHQSQSLTVRVAPGERARAAATLVSTDSQRH